MEVKEKGSAISVEEVREKTEPGSSQQCMAQGQEVIETYIETRG